MRIMMSCSTVPLSWNDGKDDLSGSGNGCKRKWTVKAPEHALALDENALHHLLSQRKEDERRIFSSSRHVFSAFLKTPVRIDLLIGKRPISHQISRYSLMHGSNRFHDRSCAERDCSITSQIGVQVNRLIAEEEPSWKSLCTTSMHGHWAGQTSFGRCCHAYISLFSPGSVKLCGQKMMQERTI